MNPDKEQNPLLWTEKENTLEDLITRIRSGDAVITTREILCQQDATADIHGESESAAPLPASFL